MKIMRLDEAIKEKIVRNSDKVDPNALFPKKKMVILPHNITGAEETQKVYRQDFEYVFFKTRVKRKVDLTILAIGKDSDKNGIVSLKGSTGYLYDWKCWKNLNTMYSNYQNGILAYGIKEEFLELLFKRNKRFEGFKLATWINEKCLMSNGYGKVHHCIKFVRKRSILEKVLYINTGIHEEAGLDYCPKIDILNPSKIFVVLNSKKKNGKWKLIPTKGLLKWRYRLF